MNQILFCIVLSFFVSIAVDATTISIDGTRWRIDGELTYPGTPAEGLLLNARMVNCTFEDRARSDFDAEANTDRFVTMIPNYVSCGIRAFTLNLQGGHAGYEGAVNSAFNPDGSLRPDYTNRVKRVIDACQKQGAIVVLGLFYQRQDQVLRDAEAVKAGVVNAVRWIQESRFTNVMVEIANEYAHPGFDHDIVRTVEGELELIRLAKHTGPELWVSTSGLGNGRMDDRIATATDFILIHFNNTNVEDIPARIQALKRYGKPIVCNEDDKTGLEGANALRASVEHGCSWGFMHNRLNQYMPFKFKGYDDDPAVYDTFIELTGSSSSIR